MEIKTWESVRCGPFRLNDGDAYDIYAYTSKANGQTYDKCIGMGDMLDKKSRVKGRRDRHPRCRIHKTRVDNTHLAATPKDVHFTQNGDHGGEEQPGSFSNAWVVHKGLKIVEGEGRT